MESLTTPRIRKCTQADIGLLLKLGIRTFIETFAAANTRENMDLYLSQKFTAQRLAAELSEQGSVFFLAESNGTPLGYAKVRRSEAPPELSGYDCMEIERIYVVKDSIGAGVGKALMQTCLDHAAASGCNVVWLGVWEHNDRALAFYRRWGFERFGHHTFMLGNDAQTDHLMKKLL